MNRRHGHLLKWIAGVVGSVIAGVILFLLVQPGGLLNRDPAPDPDPRQVWRQGTLLIPVTVGEFGRVADLDGGRLLPLGTSVPARDADIAVRQAVHGIVVEPGLSRGDGVTFDARFLKVGDAPAGAAGCAAAVIAPSAANHLQLSSSVHVGSHVCMVTSEGRLAEFEVLQFDNTRRELTIRYTVWERQ